VQFPWPTQPYIWTEEGWLYLAAVLDLYSRSVVGWAMAERMTRKLVVSALTMAVWRRRPEPGVVVHSDRGSPYASGDYQALLETHGFLCSMSRKGDCYDNAAMESFFHSLKVEQVNGCRYRTREEAKADVFEYIETYYSPANYDLYTAAAKPKLIFINQCIMINKATGCMVVSQQNYTTWSGGTRP